MLGLVIAGIYGSSRGGARKNDGFGGNEKFFQDSTGFEWNDEINIDIVHFNNFEPHSTGKDEESEEVRAKKAIIYDN